MARPLLPAVRRIGPLASLDELRQAVDDLQEFVQTREPLESGDPLNKYLTLRAAVDAGLVIYQGPGGGGSGGGIGVPPGTPVPPPDYDDLTPPDPITGLTVTALPTGFFVEFDAPSYSQGGGNAYSIIYRANYSGSGPLPTFGDAEEVGRTTERSPILVLAAEPGTTSHFWAQPVSHAEDFNGVAPQTAPTGGTNGVSATAGTMGNQHLGDLIITAEKLSQGTYPGINLIPNAGAEDGVVAWAANESSGAGGTFSVDTSQKHSGSQSFKIGKAATGDGYNIVCLAMPVIPGETYAFKARVKGSSATATGLYLRLNESITKPAGNYVTAAVRTSLTNIVSNGAVATAWTQYEDTYTVPAGIYWVSVALYNWTTGPLSMWFDDLSFGRQITAALLAAECIAVGTAAIQDAAIVTAMIDNLAVTNAKIASLSADKLIANSLAVGVELKSTGFVHNSAGFYLEAGGDAEFNNIVARGTIYATAGLIGGITIGSTNIRSGQTAFHTGTGFWLGIDGSTPKFSIGNPSGNYMYWDGTDLVVNGEFTGTVNLPAFSASIDEGSTFIDSRSNGRQVYNTFNVTATGGKSPYAYQWSLSRIDSDNDTAPIGIFITSTPTADNIDISGLGTDNVVIGYITCLVTDSDQRACRTGFSIAVTHGTPP